MSDLTPLDGVRSEHFLNGEDIKPITRREHFYAGQESKLPEGHQKPETREEWFIKKFRGSGGSSVTVEALTVTENGTYSEEGKAYSPVTVNVDKGLEIVDLDKADIVTFADGLALPITSGKFYINAQQDLNGYDKPWVGGTNYNKWDEEWEVGAILNGAPVDSATSIRSKNFCACQSNTEMYIHIGVYIYVFLFFYDENFTYIEQINGRNSTITTPLNAKYFKISLPQNYGATYNNNISINYPSSATSYVPYSNICPITGFSSMDVAVCEINVWDEEWEQGYIYNGNNYNATDRIRSKNYIPCIPNKTYCYVGGNSATINIFYYDVNKTYISTEGAIDGQTRTTPSNAYYIRFYMGAAYGNTYNNDISINYPSTDTSYHAYNGHTYSTTFNDTVYGGYYDSVNGKLVSTYGNIAIYNGESLPGAWLSSMDEYVEGATPTTGAQVVYELATPTETDAPTTCISTIEGTNNIYHNCNGETEISVLKEA